MAEAELLKLFPNLKPDDFTITSPIDYFYNCFAWAGSDNQNKWQPTRTSNFVWFTGSNSDSLENFIENYGYVGYKEIADSAEYEEGFEKIAIYVDADELPAHAARQTDNGFWTSKLGNLEDIEHKTLECLEGNDYGTVKVILKRPKGVFPMQKAKTEKKADSSKSEEFENFRKLAKNIINVPKKEVDDLMKKSNKKKTKK
jgi:hypothetical protein